MNNFSTSITNSTAGFFRQSQAQIGSLRADAERLQLQISTGERLERSSDDPVAAARLRSLSRTGRLAEIDSANAARASEELNAASTSLADIADTLIRARELALQAANGAIGQDARNLIADEMEQLRSAVLASANAVSSIGRSLFGGEISGDVYILDASGDASFVGTPTSGTLPIGEGVEAERGLTGPAVFNFSANGTLTDIFAYLKDLSAGLRGPVDPAQFARDALAGLDSALDNVNRGQTILGARAAWIDNVQQTATLRGEARAQEGGEIGGTDLASAISELQQTLTVLEASQASFVRLASLSLFDAI